MTTPTTLEAEIEKSSTFRNEVREILNEPESYGGIEDRIDNIASLLIDCADRAIGKEENIRFLSTISVERARAKNQLRSQIRSTFQDIIEGRELI